KLESCSLSPPQSPDTGFSPPAGEERTQEVTHKDSTCNAASFGPTEKGHRGKRVSEQRWGKLNPPGVGA
ncbi:unnamed protein product, partial [Gulo gulo]